MCFITQLGQYAGASGKLRVWGSLRFMTDTIMLLTATLSSTATCQLLGGWSTRVQRWCLRGGSEGIQSILVLFIDFQISKSPNFELQFLKIK